MTERLYDSDLGPAKPAEHIYASSPIPLTDHATWSNEVEQYLVKS